MARLLGMHEIELSEGADPVEFERLFAESAAQPDMPGWKTRLLRGERGERAGKYAVLFEIESSEARDRFFPAADQRSEDLDRFNVENPAAAEIWQRLFTYLGSDVTTDYLVIVE